MARMPGTTWVGEKSPMVAMSRYDIVCVHTIVGYAPAHAAHFSTRANGAILQSRDTKYRSGANLDGNHRIIAIENEDHGTRFGSWNVNDGHDVPGFTTEQIESIAQIIAWANKTHGIPIALAPNSRSTSRGVAYHRQGIDGDWSSYAYGGRVSGGETWTRAYGKVCPGDRRIKQLIEQIIPRARVIAGGATTTPEDWFDMATKQELKDALSEVLIAHAQTGTELQRMVKQQAANGVDQALGGTNVPAKLIDIIWLQSKVKRGTNPDGTPVYVSTLQELADSKTYAVKAAGLDVDEAEIAASVGAILLPIVQSAVTDALAKVDGVDEQAVAKAVVDQIAGRLGA